VKSKRRKSLRVDIHCHYLNPEAAAKVAPLNPAQYEAQIQFANELTRAVNVKQMKDRGPKLSDIELRLKEMDRMESTSRPCRRRRTRRTTGPRPASARELARSINDRIAELVAKWPDRFVGLGPCRCRTRGSR
jgi:aminocarboxymuconate-semialdehyde decarboxylase